jgi:hypothetical protein
MAPDRTILHLVKEKPRPPPHLKNYGVHTIKPQFRPWQVSTFAFFLICLCVLSFHSPEAEMICFD